MKAIPLILLLILAVALALFFWGGDFPFFQAAPRADGPLRLAGVVTAAEAVVSAEISGRVQKSAIQEGRRVERQELLVQLERGELEAERENQAARISQLKAKLNKSEEMALLHQERVRKEEEQAQAQLDAVISQRGQLEAELEQLRKDAQRSLRLLRKNLVPRQEHELSETKVRVAEARLNSLEDQIAAHRSRLELARANRRQVTVALQEVEQCRAELKQARAGLRQIDVRLGQTEIRAPISGMIALRVVREGEVVRAGDPIATIVDLDDVWVKTELEETYIEQLAVGQKLSVELPSGDILEGTVSFIAPEADFATQRDVSRIKRDIRTFTVKVAVPNSDRRLHPGMTSWVLFPQAAGGAREAGEPRPPGASQ